MADDMLAPVVALVLWSFVMWAWLYATRIPAITRLKLKYDPYKPNSEFLAKIPAEVRWKADNYNNLMEQPTLFYAIALTLALWVRQMHRTSRLPGFMWLCALSTA
jgi:hypothetical protein